MRREQLFCANSYNEALCKLGVDGPSVLFSADDLTKLRRADRVSVYITFLLGNARDNAKKSTRTLITLAKESGSRLFNVLELEILPKMANRFGDLNEVDFSLTGGLRNLRQGLTDPHGVGLDCSSVLARPAAACWRIDNRDQMTITYKQRQAALRQQKRRQGRRRIDYLQCEVATSIIDVAKADIRWPVKQSEILDGIIIEWAAQRTKEMSNPRPMTSFDHWLRSLGL